LLHAGSRRDKAQSARASHTCRENKTLKCDAHLTSSTCSAPLLAEKQTSLCQNSLLFVIIYTNK
jgi:hypothetical protein